MGVMKAATPDGRGGFWASVQQSIDVTGGHPDVQPHQATYFYHYTDGAHKAVFDDAPNPVEERITDLVGTRDGTVWVSTESDRIYRYDRLTGWERLRVKGWDPGRVVTRPSRAHAIAVNDDGVGVAVGEGGRIADVSRDRVVLDPASGRRCSDEPQPPTGPCGTPRTLRAAAVAPDGSAMVGGEKLSLLWRPAGGAFRTIDRPRASVNSKIVGISMPTASRAWLVTEGGEVWSGVLSDRWRWTLESPAAKAADERGRAQLNALAVDTDGAGLAVGNRGAMLERSPDGRWTRIVTGYLDNFYSVALPPAGYGDGTLVGGGIGVILTRVNGSFHPARRSDMFDTLSASAGSLWSSRIVGLAMSGGTSDGDVEAWAASQMDTGRDPAPFAILHYQSGDDALMNPGARAKPLPDAPDPVPGELTFAAFGRSECQLDAYCPEFGGNNLFNEIVTRRIQGELRERRKTAGPGFAAIFTGDVSIGTGRDQKHERRIFVDLPNTPLDRNVVHAQWREFVANPLVDDGIPLFGVPGKNDVSRVKGCTAGPCADTQDNVDAGSSLQWREAFATMAKPWGGGGELSSDGVTFRAVEDGSDTAVEAPGGGARTHYALDMVRGGKAVARLVFIDNSFARSLTVSDANQNPVEGDGGQLGWLERMLCIRGETCATGGTRSPGQHAVVVSNAPTYSYGPGGLDATQADGSVLETLLVRHRATASIAGRLGWNGLYYTLATGLHSPCPGDPYPNPEDPPEATSALCEEGAEGAAELPPVPAASDVAQALRGLGAPPPPVVEDTLGAADDAQRPIPTLVSSTAGGRFGPEGTETGPASSGFWHGYGVMRVRPDGGVVVEQRPILDWIGIEASVHTLRPGQRVTLRGYGREPVGTDTSVRMIEIDSPAVTHRYDLVEADPEKPWMPKVVEGSPQPHGYVSLDRRIGSVDRQSGRVKAEGKMNHGRVYALAILSVGKKAASWPLVFEPRKTYVAPEAPRVAVPAVPALKPPAIRVLSAAAAAPSQPPPAAPPPPISANLSFPSPPPLPTIPTVSSAPTTPPVPPPVPPPPPQQVGSALNLNLDVAGLSITPPAAPVPQPAPPINPAPPGGARKEAKQRQAAVAKSEEGGGESNEGVDPSDAQARVNEVSSPNSYTRPGGADSVQRYDFTAAERRSQPSAWSRGALYGGALGLMALTLAIGFTTVRPTPRRRPPELPAPAWARETRPRDSIR
jgi:hypothetical protein